MSSETITKNDLANILEGITALDGENMTEEEVDTFVDSLNVTGINAVDYIIDQGTSGIWAYRRWNSGIAECWGIYESAITGSTSWGSVYYTTVKTVSFPTSLFIERPSCSITSIGNGVQGWGTSNRCTKDEIDVFLMRPTNASDGTPSLSLHAIGRWK